MCVDAKLERDNAIDLVKGILIISVVLCHDAGFVELCPNAMFALYAFHVPLFFLISCFFISHAKPRKATVFIKKRAFGLVPPMLAIFFVALLGRNTAGGWEDKDITSILGDVAIGIGWGNAASFEQAIGSTYLWFIPAALTMNVLFYLLLHSITRRELRYAISSLLSLFVWLMVGVKEHRWIPWGIDTAFLLCPLCLFSSELYRAGMLKSRRLRVIAAIMFPTLLWLVITELGDVGLHGFYLPRHAFGFLSWWAYLILGLVLVYWFASIAIITEVQKFRYAIGILKCFGEKSLWIYLLHPFFLHGFNFLVHDANQLNQDWTFVPIMIARVTIAVVGPYLFVASVQKSWPVIRTRSWRC